MGWLDGLRAVAVGLVVYAHISRYFGRPVRGFTAEWLHAGPAGVMLFFLVSGYIIPASLERHGDLRRFWAGRLGRLMPLYLAVLVVVVVATGEAVGPATVVGHLTMLPFLLHVPLITPVLWTLSYEMAFYLLAAGLFALRRHRASAFVAAGFAVAGVVTAPIVPLRLHPYVLVLALTVLILTAAFLFRAGAVAGGLLAVTLLMLNQDPSHVWDGLLIVAVMFTGTAVYRADSGQVGWWQPALAGSLTAAGLLINWFRELISLHALIPRYEARAVITLLVFAGAFAFGMLTRQWSTPGWLARLGRISYSVYLVHYVVIAMLSPYLLRLADRLHGPAEIPAAAGFLALVAGLSGLTYRFVEIPGRELVRRLVGDARTNVGLKVSSGRCPARAEAKNSEAGD